MKGVLRLSYFFMAVAVALGVFLAFKYQSLSASVKSTRATLATFQSASLYVQGGSYAYEDWANRFKGLCASGSRDPKLIDFCQNQWPSLEPVQRLGPAFRARMSAPLTGDYNQMRESYEAVAGSVEKQPASAWRSGWLALAKEGIAYAEMKLGRLDEAEAIIKDAMRLGPNDAGVGATALKIQCVRHAPSKEVAAGFASITGWLDKQVAATSPETEAGRNARLEREYFGKDGELYQLCGYANLRPPSGA